MNAAKLQIRDGVVVYNNLDLTTDPEYLTQDVLAVELATGFWINVGWFPQHNLEGRYLIRVFYQDWNDQRIPPIEAKTVDQVVCIVEGRRAIQFPNCCHVVQ